jgi:hypothetical protein
VRRAQRRPDAGGAEPLQRFTVTNGGLDPATVGVLLVGLAEGPEYAPVLVNVTNGQALVFLGAVPPGARLWIRSIEGDEGSVLEARLEGDDVSDRLRGIDGLVPGVPWDASQALSPARPLVLDRGVNDLWFLPVAHYDVRGLDRALLALADLALKQGRWDETEFDASLFAQDPALALHLSWVETTPATLHIDLPGGLLRSRAGESQAAMAAREQLEFALDQGVDRLAAAGVVSQVRLRPFASAQRQRDRLTAVLPLRHREVGPTGGDHLPDAGGVFGITNFEDATFR